MVRLRRLDFQKKFVKDILAKMNSPLISVVVPIYNIQQYLFECLASIRKQTFSNFEVILVDDGSTDICAEICQVFVNQDQRFKYFYQVNAGLEKAREFGVSKARGQFTSFVDGDDKVTETYLEKLVKPLIEGKADVSICSFYWWQPEIKRLRAEPEPKIKKVISPEEFASSILSVGNWEKNCISGGYVWNKMYKTEHLKGVHLPAIPGAEDEVFLFELLPVIKRIVCVEGPLYFYRQRATSLVNRKSFSYLHSLSRELIFDKGPENYKNIAGVGFVQKVIQLIVNILSGKEKDPGILKETKRLAAKSINLLNFPEVQKILTDKDKKHSFLLAYRLIPDIFLMLFLRLRGYKLSSFMITQMKRFKGIR